ncbi:HAUS augmin-like complex subunit 5 [Arapaima gigas]
MSFKNGVKLNNCSGNVRKNYNPQEEILPRKSIAYCACIVSGRQEVLSKQTRDTCSSVVLIPGKEKIDSLRLEAARQTLGFSVRCCGTVQEMGDRTLPQELKRWVVEEFNLVSQRLPSDSYFKTLCLGQGAPIWRFVTRHVYNQRNVKMMRGNLQWYKMLQDSEVCREQGQSEAERRQSLKQEIEELRAELSQLDVQICGAEEQLAAEEQSIKRSWDLNGEDRRKELLLRGLGQRCLEERCSLEQEIRRVAGHCQTLEQLSRKAEVELVFGGDGVDSTGASLGPSGPEPQVLREVRELCEERLLFFQSLLESELKHGLPTAAHMSREQRGAVFQHWLSAVEDLLCSHPPNHILAALQHLASRQQGSLQEKLACLDVAQDISALRYRYESSHLHDLSKNTEELPSVKSLIQSGWEEVEQMIVQLAQTRVRVLQKKSQLDARWKKAELEQLDNQAQIEPLAGLKMDLELQYVMQAATRNSVLEQCEALNHLARARQEALHTLRTQWQSIMDFRQLVDLKQEQIRGLIKGNSTVKSEVSRVHSEVGQFVKGKLGPLCWGVVEAAGKLRNMVSQETKQAAGVSLAVLDCRVISSMQRVPAECLSIHCLQSGTFHTLCQNLAFPISRAPEQLCAQAVSQQLQLRFLRRLLQLHSVSLVELQNQRALLPTADMQALLQQVHEADKELLHSLLPRVKELSQCASQALLYAGEAKTTIAHWWEQPAQFALPEMTREGLALQQWLQRWRLAAKARE